MFKDTICATSTAQGIGALGIIRVSGEDAFPVVDRIFKGRNLNEVSSHTVHYGFIVNSDSEEVIDEVMVSVFHAPKTFTAENLVEISCHGSPYIQERIIEILIRNGARLAEPGEFTQRAFLNGRIDLAQAEAVADLISAQNKASHKVALNQMRGGITSELKVLRESLIDFTALIELELDFSDEDVEFADRKELDELVKNLKGKIQHLLQTFEYGNAIKNGVPVAIIGKPNAGKSTLLNALLNEERAIVSDIAGTTRDTIEETLTIDGISFRFIDTAGIRETRGQIEAIGVERAKEKVEQAKINIYTGGKGNMNLSFDNNGQPLVKGKNVDQWDREWKFIARLSEMELHHLKEYNKSIGLYKAVLNGKIVYIGRAIEYANGGFRKRLRDYTRDSNSARKHQSGQKMNEHRNLLDIYFLVVGNSAEDVNHVKVLERAFIRKYRPEWNVQFT